MTEALLLLDQLHDELSKFKALPFVPWEQANRAQLVERLKQWHDHTKQSKELVTLLQLEQLKHPEMKSINLREAETFLVKTDEVLARNMNFEKDKTNRKIDLTEKIHTPALGAELEARMHRQWLTLHRAHEQLAIALRKTLSTNTSAKAIEGELFNLVKTKEEEIQNLKNERDQLKREKFFTNNEKYSLTEMENDLQDLLQRFAIEKHALYDHLEQGKKKLDEYSTHHMHLDHKTKKLEQMVNELQKKHVGISTVLKKERDYARKLALDLEGEAASIRATYAKELLTLDEKKHALRQEVEEKHAQKIALLEKKVREQEHIIRELDAIAREKEREVARLAEKIPEKERKELVTRTKKMVS
ncbi:MAG: hypothetical protein FJY86_01545 [Candidatus Diapherotrites archaeon]|uniref:Uncharacterized protein n=1 Tax=Candidatus Iainarchaeum sp. TaxID=3101447 RepID=A0A8T4CAP1_9ARCH|nr:hypothetical protein [Candidatus Diapherotrites archaeon]